MDERKKKVQQHFEDERSIRLAEIARQGVERETASEIALQKKLAEHQRKFKCHVCGTPSSGPSPGGSTSNDEGDIIEKWNEDWEDSENLRPCFFCERWTCFNCRVDNPYANLGYLHPMCVPCAELFIAHGEVCEITYSLIPPHKARWVAEATGSGGKFKAGESPPFNIYYDEPHWSDGKSEHKALINMLIKNGWKTTEMYVLMHQSDRQYWRLKLMRLLKK